MQENVSNMQELDEILLEPESEFKKGVEEGQIQSRRHNTADIEKDAYQLGYHLGKYLAAIQAFVDVFVHNEHGAVHSKYLKDLQDIGLKLKQLNTKDLQMAKSEIIFIVKEFKVYTSNIQILLAKLGIKNYAVEILNKEKDNSTQY